MEAATATRRPPWLAGLAPLAVLAVAIGLFVVLDAPGIDRIGVPQEQLAVERTVLKPDEIQLHVRNDGADPVRVRQVIVNDAFAAFTQSDNEIGRLGGSEIDVQYPWIEGQDYEVVLLTETGATIDHTIDGRHGDAGRRPRLLRPHGADRPLRGDHPGRHRDALAALAPRRGRPLDPLPARLHDRPARLPRDRGAARGNGVRQRERDGVRRRGARLAGRRRGLPGAGGGGCLAARAALACGDGARAAAGNGDGDGAGGAGLGYRAALLVAIGIGLHNLGEGLAIGSAYAVGSLALGAALVVGFALHNTTEGLAIVAPVARDRAARVGQLALLGLIAGRPRRARRVDRGVGLPARPGRAHVRHRRGRDRAGHRPDRPADPRHGRPRSPPARRGRPAHRPRASCT